MQRIEAVSAVLVRTETLVHREGVEKSFEEALQNAWFRLRGISAGDVRSEGEASRPSRPSERTPTARPDGKAMLVDTTRYGELQAESSYGCVVYCRVARV